MRAVGLVRVLWLLSGLSIASTLQSTIIGSGATAAARRSSCRLTLRRRPHRPTSRYEFRQQKVAWKDMERWIHNARMFSARGGLLTSVLRVPRVLGPVPTPAPSPPRSSSAVPPTPSSPLPSASGQARASPPKSQSTRCIGESPALGGYCGWRVSRPSSS